MQSIGKAGFLAALHSSATSCQRQRGSGPLFFLAAAVERYPDRRRRSRAFQIHADGIRQYPAPAPPPRHAGGGPSLPDPYPHAAFFRWPAAPPRAFLPPRPRPTLAQAVPDPSHHASAWLYRPVGSVVVFLRRPRRSRSGAGWGSPRIIAWLGGRCAGDRSGDLWVELLEGKPPDKTDPHSGAASATTSCRRDERAELLPVSCAAA